MILDCSLNIQRAAEYRVNCLQLKMSGVRIFKFNFEISFLGNE